MCWPNSFTRRYSMNFGPEEDADQHRRHPRDQDLAHQAHLRRQRRQLSATASRPAEREPLTRTASPGSSCAASSSAASSGVGDELVGVVVAGRLADADQEVDAGGAGVLADLAVVAGGVRRRARAISPSTAIRRAAPSRRREVVERGAHRDRVGVVAVVHEDDPVGELEALAAEAGEAYARSAVGHLRERRRRARPRRRSRPARWSGCGPRRRGSGSAGARRGSRSAPR